ncbi:MAG TPA: DUF4383 domain-containing protein [Ktedonobacteraceae bacterium]|nr:DUF4383 domain-containing protein [Ktedonobacteraceae bacterium]
MMVEQRSAMLWTVNRVFALVVGIIFVLIAIIGFFTPMRNATGVQPLFGIFDVDTVHNWIHLISGLLGIIAAFVGQARTFNQAFGIFYTLLGILGLFSVLYFPPGTYGHDTGLFLGLTHINAADHVLHLVAGIIALIVGFFFAGSATHTMPHERGM